VRDKGRQLEQEMLPREGDLHMLTTSQIETLRSGLVRQLAAVRREIKDEASDRDDQAVEADMAEGDDESIGQQFDEVREIEDTLSRIHAGHYGLCADCTRAIEYERFTAYPTRTRCVKCEAAHERP
jgi:DnaK suppressor protein